RLQRADAEDGVPDRPTLQVEDSAGERGGKVVDEPERDLTFAQAIGLDPVGAVTVGGGDKLSPAHEGSSRCRQVEPAVRPTPCSDDWPGFVILVLGKGGEEQPGPRERLAV